MTQTAPRILKNFDENALHIAKRQYMQPSDDGVAGLFSRVADWVAGAEVLEARAEWAQKYFDLMAAKKFCPGGRVLAGAGTQHGNVLNCLQGDTLVETRAGQVPIRELKGEVEVLSQDGVYRKAEFRSFGRQELYEVLLENGETLEATAGHEWVVGKKSHGRYPRVSTLELLGKRLPIIPTSRRPEQGEDFEEGVRHGVVYGDGSKNHERPSHAVRLFGTKRPLARYFSGYSVREAVYDQREMTIAQGMRGELKQLPEEFASDSYWYGFFCGFLATDDGIDDRGSVALYQSDLSALQRLAQQMVRFGIKASSLRLFRHADAGYGGKPAYALRMVKQTLLAQDFLREDQRERFERSFEGQTPPRNASLQVVSVKATGRTEEVFCCVEHQTHTFVVQGGLLTGNCFVQGATEFDPSSFEGVMEVAKKLALVTKVGGGNGVNLDVYTPRSSASRSDAGVRGWVYMSAAHKDVEDFLEGMMRPPTQPDGDKVPMSIRNWTRVVYGQAIAPDLVARARANGVLIVRQLPEGVLSVSDDMGGIIDSARWVAEQGKMGLEPRIDLTPLRAEGTAIKGSGGTSSGPVSFLVEIFDNFLEWANLGAETSGPVNTLRYCYSPVLRVVRQGGCLHPDTLVHTSKGTLRLRELVDPLTYGWHTHALEVATDEGWKHSPETFNNGVADTLKVTLENGLNLQGTPNHKLKVLREDGSREWVALENLQKGDWAIQVLDQHTGAPVLLEPLSGELHFNTKPISTPETLTERLAFWLGYLWGDGFISGNRVGFAVHQDSPMMLETPRLFRELFGLELSRQQKPDDKSVIFMTRSTALVRWLEQNGLHKGKALTLELPRAIRQAPRPVLGAFLRGLFEADGTLSHGYPQLSSASRQFAEDVLVLLGGLGIPAKMVRYAPLENRYSNREHFRLGVVSAKGLERYTERIGWLEGSRFTALAEFKPDLDRESSWPLPHARGLLERVHTELPAGRKNSPSPFTQTRKTLSRYIRGERGLTGTGYAALQENEQISSVLPQFDFEEYYVQVRDIEVGGRILTLDLSVDENHTYLAGGMVTHNTRRGAGMATISIEHADVLDFLTAKDLDRESSEGDISTFNISILVGEAFWETLQADELWNLEARDVPGKYHPVKLEGKYSGSVPELPARAEDGAKGIPVYGGGIPAKWLWREIATHAWSTGEPGLVFADRINEFSALKNLGERYQIKCTNPCFVGSTRIPTEHGLMTIEQLAALHDLGKENSQFQSFLITTDSRAPFSGVGEPIPGSSGTTVRRAARAFYTGVRPVVRLTTKEGYQVELTTDHPLLTPRGYVEVGQLEVGDEVLVQSGEGLWASDMALPAKALEAVRERVLTAGSNGLGSTGSSRGRSDVRERYSNLPTIWSQNLGVVLGWLIGDGYLREDGIGFYFSDTEFEHGAFIREQLADWFGQGTLQKTASSTHHYHFNKIPAEFFAALGVKAVKATEKRVPDSLFTAPREAVIGFLRGLFSSDGTVNRVASNSTCSVRLASSSRALLEDVQLLLINLGIFSRLHKRRDAHTKSMPDGKGGAKDYQCAAQFELILGSGARDQFARMIGFLIPEKQQKLEAYIKGGGQYHSYHQYKAKVRSIEILGEQPVYDLTEPVTHSLIANSFVSHNCGEIPLTIGEPCDLGAINLAAYVKHSSFDYPTFRRDIRTCVRFLDDVLEVNVFALEDNRVASQSLRRLGLGVMGLADALILMGQRYDSEAGRDTIYEIMSVLREEALLESENLALERGAYSVYTQNAEKVPHGPRRNVAVLTVAPTGTTSMLMGVSSGIEPIYSPFIWRKIGSEYRSLVAPLLIELLETYPAHARYSTPEGGWDWDKVSEGLSSNHGSVMGLDFIPEAIQQVFVCAHDIAALEHVRMQGTVQRAFDAEGYGGNSLSKTINMANEATVEDVENAYSEAYRTGCKGITVYRDGSRQFQVLSTSKKAKKTEETEEVTSSATSSAEPIQTSSQQANPRYERPSRLHGITDMVKLTDPTTGGRRSFLVTVNCLEERPVEVMVISGRAGDEANADSEALGRVVSIALQYGVPADALIKTLRGINGGLYGSYNGRLVGSKADLIAVALETYTQDEKKSGVTELGVLEPVQQHSEPQLGGVVFDTGMVCQVCSSKALVKEEGCVKCMACGYSKCG